LSTIQCFWLRLHRRKHENGGKVVVSWWAGVPLSTYKSSDIYLQLKERYVVCSTVPLVQMCPHSPLCLYYIMLLPLLEYVVIRIWETYYSCTYMLFFLNLSAIHNIKMSARSFFLFTVSDLQVIFRIQLNSYIHNVHTKFIPIDLSNKYEILWLLVFIFRNYASYKLQ